MKKYSKKKILRHRIRDRLQAVFTSSSVNTDYLTQMECFQVVWLILDRYTTVFFYIQTVDRNVIFLYCR